MSLKSKPYFEDIICAQASPEGVGAISIIRVSGKGCSNLLSKLLEKSVASLQTHRSYYKKVYYNSKFLDEALFTYFEEGKSFTGEESFEAYVHGSPLIVNNFINVFYNMGARLAEPGEFSYRAYLNGKIDLTKAEGIHHSIHARSEISKNLALNLLEGGFKNHIIKIKENLVWAASRVEASIDFSDQDIDLDHDEEVFSRINKSKAILAQLVESYSVGSVQSKGVSVALCGPPNSGKSTLFNALLNDQRSIVSEQKGTTRDYLRESISLKNHTIQIVDTAGLRTSSDSIESEGIKRSLDLASKSQLILYLVSKDTEKESRLYLNELRTFDIPVVLLETKQDQGPWSFNESFENSMKISAYDESDVLKIKDSMYEHLKKYLTLEKSLFVQRHKNLIAEAYEDLSKISDFNEICGQEDVISSLLYSSIDHLDEILYIDDPEAVRDQIFKDFCLGK